MNDTTLIVSQEAQYPSSQTIIKATACLLAMSAAFIAPQAAHAQERATWLDTLTVVGTRTELSVQDNPASVSVVDEEDIQRRSGDSIADMLRDVPGVEVTDESVPGMKRLRIRGESSRRVTILVDGQEITDHSNYGTPILIDPSNVERIEVVRGPASVLHGAKAIGGVINIVTKRGADKPIQFEAGGTYYSGTAGWQGWGAVSGTVGGFDYRLSGSLDDHGDRRVPNGRYTSTGRLEDTPFENDYLSAHLGYTFGEAGNHYVALKAEQHRLSTTNWVGELDPSITHFNISLPKRDRRKVGLYYDGKDLGPVLRNVHLDAYYQTVDRLFRNEVETQLAIPGRSVGVTSTSDDKNINYGGTAQVDLQFHPDHYTIFGLHYLTDTLKADKTSTVVMTGFAPFPVTTHSASADDASIHTVSAFAQNEWSFAPDFKLTTGLRYYHTKAELNETTNPLHADYEDTTDGRLVTSTGLTYTGFEDTTLRALYSEGYISPSLVQMFMDTSAGGQTIYGNPYLDPETSRNIEVGARYNAYGLILDGTVFYTRAKNYITSTPCGTGASCPDDAPTSGYTYVNANRATTYGLELAAEYTLPSLSLTPYVSAAWTKRELEFDTYSTYNSNTPALSGRLGLRWEGEIAGNDVWSDLYVRAGSGVKQTYLSEGVLVTDTLSSYGTLNFSFGGSFGEEDRYRYGVHFNNILDKEYRSTLGELPGLGRSVEVSLRVTF